jgi:excisionase family DNA binding protein
MKSTPLKPHEAAEALGCSRKRIYSLVATGKLEAFRLERQLRIEPEAVEKFKRQRRVQVESPAPVKTKAPKVTTSSVGKNRYVM